MSSRFTNFGQRKQENIHVAYQYLTRHLWWGKAAQLSLAIMHSKFFEHLDNWWKEVSDDIVYHRTAVCMNILIRDSTHTKHAMLCYRLDIQYYQMTISDFREIGNHILWRKVDHQLCSIVRSRNAFTVESQDTALLLSTTTKLIFYSRYWCWRCTQWLK